MPPGIAHRGRVYRLVMEVRNPGPGAVVYHSEVVKDLPQPGRGGCGVRGADFAGLPLPSQRFRRRSWLTFQRALDPLAPPKPVPPAAPTPRRRPPRESG
jgi:hypothetical protein